jgi:hypothetical protein
MKITADMIDCFRNDGEFVNIKEQDEETGLYYYGARYLDSRTSRWLSTDPALGDYIPGAPINDEAKKRNGNLPGMGGVFNTVNLHLYHYAGNNPVKYTDPDGRESGFVIDENAVGPFGHAGWFVKTDSGYSFFEVTGLPDTAIAGENIVISDENRHGEILSNSPISSPTPGSAKSFGKATSAGVLRTDFSSKPEMLSYLGKVGDKGGFDSFIEFNTTPDQDKTILAASENFGKIFNGYQLIGNSCGSIARDVLTTRGSGISKNSPSGLGFVAWNNAPNGIGAQLWITNSNIASKNRIQK